MFGARVATGRSELDFAYRPLLAGCPLLISFVTVAELRFGARIAGWGDRRLERLERRIAGARTVWPVDESSLVEAYVRLRASCVRTGHGLGHKDHEADRWIAATALWLDIPLVVHDSIFMNVDGLRLLTRVGG